MMLTPCWPRAGPTGGAGVARPALICSLTTAASFFLGGIRLLSVLLDLAEGQLDRRLPAEDLDQTLDLLGVRVDLVDGRLKRGERPVDDGDRVADLEVQDLDLRGAALLLLLRLRCQDLHDLVE